MLDEDNLYMGGIIKSEDLMSIAEAEEDEE